MRFTQVIPVSLLSFILIFVFLVRTRQVSPSLSSGGYQLLYKSRDGVHSHCTLQPMRREPVLRLYSDSVHIYNGVTTLPSTFIK